MDSDKPWFQTRKDSLWAGQKLFDLYKKGATLGLAQKKMQKQANDLGLDFFSSPFDLDAVIRLEGLNVPAYKIASLEITDIPLIRAIARTGKPVILSSGIAEVDDIELALQTIRNEGTHQIALLKCTSAYPTPYSEINLNAIPLIQEKFNVIPGLSDHTLGIAVPVAAVAKGARIIEKHFILDKHIPSVDRDFSLSPKNLRRWSWLSARWKSAWKFNPHLTPRAQKARESARSLFVVKDLKKGEVLSAQNIRSLRPAKGLHPKYYDSILGKKVKRDIEKGTPLDIEMLE